MSRFTTRPNGPHTLILDTHHRRTVATCGTAAEATRLARELNRRATGRPARPARYRPLTRLLTAAR